MTYKKKLLDLAKTFPQCAGCYLMLNASKDVIYVGKAKNLKNRVSSYFQDGTKTPKTEILVSHIRNVEFIITDTEAEAFVLENNLIKKYTPKYNIHLRDDKSYPYVQIKMTEPFPRLEYTRRPQRKKGNLVYGPYVSGSGLSQVLKVLTKIFQLRDCNLREFNSRKRPCLLYQMKQCSAPCVNYITDVEYQKNLDLALGLFKTSGKKTLKFLEKMMVELAENEEFERASIIRDSIDTLTNFLDYGQKHAELSDKDKNIDLISFYQGDLEVDISIYMVRRGLLLGQKNFSFPRIDMLEHLHDEILMYLLQYYSTTNEQLPESIVIDMTDKQLEVFQMAMNDLYKIKVSSVSKKYQGIIKLSNEHAKESQRVRLQNQESVFVGLNRLMELIGLRERPKYIECFDVAVWQGKSPTASQVVFEDGKPLKKKYRYYHLQERPEGNNDFAMMTELFERRLDNGNLPDVFLVDGGVQQVNTVKKVLDRFECRVPVVGIAKSRTLNEKSNSSDVNKTDERLIIPGRMNPYILKKSPSLFRILTQLRDEAHRFSRKLHHKAESKRLLSSPIDQIHGVGPKTAEKIKKYYLDNINEISELTSEKLVQEIGLKEQIASEVIVVLKKLSSTHE